MNDRRALGQNFLVDNRHIHRFVRAAGIAGTDLVWEIGPGRGALTGPLLKRAARVEAFEIDLNLARKLRDRFRAVAHFTCRPGDFRDAAPPRRPFRVVANVPYAITTDVVRWCVEARTLRDATLLTQLEFARKQSGGYGRWTKLAVLSYPDVEMTFHGRVPRSAFRPRPRVDGGILRLRRHERPLLPGGMRRFYRDLVATGFEGRGGSLYASLKRGGGQVDRAFDAAGIPRAALVGEVAPEQWITLAKSLAR
ncbi:23S ribosomal RNA methyltransferase Erm [Salininema proteolyticum]|uniref:23S ribosomal RNA methyltransferase Erm n=1 Tax=Salininema proteolyticum TaxID=1607685 RepID=A0ABV8TVC8_9ACTN